MKKLYSAAITAVLSVSALVGFGQKYDIAITAINNPSANVDTFYSNISTTRPNFTVENPGPSVTSAADTMVIRYAVNGTQTGPLQWIPAPLNNGQTRQLNTAVDINFADANLGLTTGEHDFCLWTELKNDTNPSNDTSCVKIYYSATAANVDLEAVSIEIIQPTPGTGNTIDLGSSITQINFTMRNAGSVTLKSGTVIPYFLTVNGDARQVNGTLTADWAPGTNTTRQITNTSVIGAIPTGIQSFDVCGQTNFTGDVDNSNDIICETYNTVGVVISDFSPKNGPVGTEVTITGAGFDATAANNTVEFKDVAATVKSATATELKVEAPRSTTGRIKVTVGGKSATSTSSYRYDFTSVNEVKNLTDKVFYAEGALHYEMRREINTDDLLIRVYNTSGQEMMNREVETSEVDGKSINVNVSDLPSGVYIADLNGLTYRFAK